MLAVTKYAPRHAGDIDTEVPEWLHNLLDFANSAHDEIEYAVSLSEEAVGNAESARDSAEAALSQLSDLIDNFENEL